MKVLRNIFTHVLKKKEEDINLRRKKPRKYQVLKLFQKAKKLDKNKYNVPSALQSFLKWAGWATRPTPFICVFFQAAPQPPPQCLFFFAGKIKLSSSCSKTEGVVWQKNVVFSYSFSGKTVLKLCNIPPQKFLHSKVFSAKVKCFFLLFLKKNKQKAKILVVFAFRKQKKGGTPVSEKRSRVFHKTTTKNKKGGEKRMKLFLGQKTFTS